MKKGDGITEFRPTTSQKPGHYTVSFMPGYNKADENGVRAPNLGKEWPPDAIGENGQQIAEHLGKKNTLQLYEYMEDADVAKISACHHQQRKANFGVPGGKDEVVVKNVFSCLQSLSPDFWRQFMSLEPGTTVDSAHSQGWSDTKKVINNGQYGAIITVHHAFQLIRVSPKIYKDSYVPTDDEDEDEEIEIDHDDLFRAISVLKFNGKDIRARKSDNDKTRRQTNAAEVPYYYSTKGEVDHAAGPISDKLYMT